MSKVKKSTYDPKIYTKEAKIARFHRVGERRISRILKDLKLVGNMSNPNLYLYTNEEVKKIFDTLDEVIIGIKAKFRTTDGYYFKF